MVQGAARSHPYQRQISRHQPHRHIRLLVVWPPRLPAAYDNGMRGRPGHVELDKETISVYTSCGPQTHPVGLDHPPRFSALAPAGTVCCPLDYGAPRSISLANTTTSFSFRLCGFYAPGQVEATPTRQQAPSYRQVSGCHRLAAILK